MKKEYKITGMSCSSCLGKMEAAFEGVENAKIQLTYPQLTITGSTQPSLEKLNELVNSKGDYHVEVGKEDTLPTMPEIKIPVELPEVKLVTYKPLLLIVTFIAGVSLLIQYPFSSFNGMVWMRHFMAGFFLVFSFFKLLNLKGFASSYAMYDIVAAKWKPWGLIYPFVELTLGAFYLLNIYSFETNLTTAIVLGISSIGVIQSNLNKKKIKCACLGDVFNLPMSTVTIIEDLTMVIMAVTMIIID